MNFDRNVNSSRRSLGFFSVNPEFGEPRSSLTFEALISPKQARGFYLANYFNFFAELHNTSVCHLLL